MTTGDVREGLTRGLCRYLALQIKPIMTSFDFLLYCSYKYRFIVPLDHFILPHVNIGTLVVKPQFWAKLLNEHARVQVMALA